jgi:TRAP-type C4-dicarboxylate transport system permease small subunit
MGATALRALARAHDGLTRLGFTLAKLCIAGIVVSYSYETIARYFFSAPTWGSNEVVGYALCIGTFLAMPEVTRRGGHIAITFVLELLGPRAGRILGIATAVTSGVVCLLVAWMSYGENVRQIANEVMLVRVEPIPKVWISAWITYGFLSSGAHFLRAALRAGGEEARRDGEPARA